MLNILIIGKYAFKITKNAKFSLNKCKILKKFSLIQLIYIFLE